MKALIIVIAFAVASVRLLSGSSQDEIVILPPFEVKEEGVVYLQMSFRAHMFFLCLKDLTFRQVPPTWRKAGIKVGDRLLMIGDQPIRGTGFIEFMKVEGERMKPLRGDTPQPVRTVFEIESIDSKRIWKYEFTQTVDSCIVYGTPEKP